MYFSSFFCDTPSKANAPFFPSFCLSQCSDRCRCPFLIDRPLNGRRPRKAEPATTFIPLTDLQQLRKVGPSVKCVKMSPAPPPPVESLHFDIKMKFLFVLCLLSGCFFISFEIEMTLTRDRGVALAHWPHYRRYSSSRSRVLLLLLSTLFHG